MSPLTFTKKDLNMVTVIKSSGEREAFDPIKIRKEIEKVCVGLDVNPLVLEAHFHNNLADEVKASEIQQHLIAQAVKLVSIEEPDWRYVAARLNIELLYHRVRATRTSNNFYDLSKEQARSNYWLDLSNYYSEDELRLAGTWLDNKRDYLFDYAGSAYLIKHVLCPNELPQELFLATSLIIASEQKAARLELAQELYEAFSKLKLSAATPVLINSIRPKGAVASCYIIQPSDDLESIFARISDAAMISKNSGGVGVILSEIRAHGAPINQRPNSSRGVVSWTKFFDTIATAVDQGGKRKAAITVGLDIWHGDLWDFLDMQTEHGDPRSKCFDIFPQLVVPDLFMRRFLRKDDPLFDSSWHLFCPFEVKEVLGLNLARLHGAEFEYAYLQAEQAYRQGDLKRVKKTTTLQVMSKIIETHMRTGLPYLAFKDTINRANPNPKYQIPGVNLCVAPETMILTKNGYREIQTLEDQEVEVWNGKEWSQTKVVKTSDESVLMDIEFNDGSKLSVTPYHKFYIKKIISSGFSSRTSEVEVQARDLKVGDVLISFTHPVFEVKDQKASEEAWTAWERGRALQNPEEYLNVETSNLMVSWLLGVIDSAPLKTVDYQVSLSPSGIKITCAESLAKTIHLLKLSLGFSSKLEYNLKTVSVLLSRKEIAYLQSNQPTDSSPSPALVYSKAPQQRLLGVKSVSTPTRVDKTYCVNEPKEHKVIFNGILTGNCTESFSAVEPDKLSHVCQLASLTVARLGFDEQEDKDLEHLCKLGVTALDNGLSMCAVPIKEGRDHVERFRTIGLGVVGLHDYLAIRKLTYTNLKEINALFEKIAYYSIKASIELAKERGVFLDYADSTWAQGKILGNRDLEWVRANSTAIPIEKWEGLFKDLQTYGIRNSHILCVAPNTSSSLVQGCTASVLPTYNKLFVDKSDSSVPVAPMYIKERFWYYKEAKYTHPTICIDAVSEMQKWVDTGISMELLFNRNENIYPQEFLKTEQNRIMPKDMAATYVHAWQKGCKAIYYVRSIRYEAALANGKVDSGCVSCAN